MNNLCCLLFYPLSFTSSHHLVLHCRMCRHCTAISNTMCQKSSGTCRRAKLFKSCFTISSYKVSLTLSDKHLYKRRSRFNTCINPPTLHFVYKCIELYNHFQLQHWSKKQEDKRLQLWGSSELTIPKYCREIIWKLLIEGYWLCPLDGFPCSIKITLSPGEQEPGSQKTSFSCYSRFPTQGTPEKLVRGREERKAMTSSRYSMNHKIKLFFPKAREHDLWN